MYFLVALFIVLAPLDTIGIYVGSGYVDSSWIVAAVIAITATWRIVWGQWTVYWHEFVWIAPFSLFLLLGTSSLLLSPYLGAAMGKGLIQVVGIAMILAVSISFDKLIDGRLNVLLALIRVCTITLGIIGLIALLQFVVNNISGESTIRFAFLNRWFDPGMIGGIQRANSIISEPAHMTTFLGAGAGLMFVRFGMLGRIAGSRIKRCVPLWAAFGILAGFATSLSIIGYGLFGIAAIATFVLGGISRPRRRQRRSIFTIIGALAAIGAVITVPIITGTEFVDKLGTITMTVDTADPSVENIKNIETNQISALAIATNVAVMLANLQEHPLIGIGLGAHPQSYESNVPDYAYLSEFLYNLNKDEAASLLIRLLSETGVLGTCVFLTGCLVILWRGWMTARLCLRVESNDEGTRTLYLIAIGLTASCIAVMIGYFMRLGVYYDAPFWAITSLTAALGCFSERLRMVIPARVTNPQSSQRIVTNDQAYEKR